MRADLIPSLEIDWENGTATKKIVVNSLTKDYREPSFYDADFCSYYFKAFPNDFILTFKYCLKRLCELGSDVVQWLGGMKQSVLTPTLKPKFDKCLHNYLINPESALFPHIDLLSRTEVAHMFDGIKLKQKVGRFLTEVGYKAHDNEMYEFVMKNLKYSYSKDLRIQWDRASRLPTKLHINERLVIDKNGETVNHRSEHWILVDSHGKTTIVDGTPTDGVCIDSDSGRTIEVYSAVPKNVPRNTLKAVKVTLGCNPVEGEMQGITIMSYRKY